MRAGEDPGAVFDALHARGQIARARQRGRRREALAARVAATRPAGARDAMVVDTREHAATLNAAIRDRLVAAGPSTTPRRRHRGRAADRCRRP